MANKETKFFDKILKENLEDLFLPIAQKWLGFKIIRAELLPDKLQRTLEREPDFVRIIETDRSEKFILHLEFQSTNDAEMRYRQAEYKAILQRKYQLPVRQFLIYLGNQPVTMQTQLPEQQHITGFELWNIQEYRYENLVWSDVPEEILLAILGDFHGEAPEKVILQIVNRLEQIVAGKLELQKFIRQLNILSGLRKLQEETTKITEDMTVEFEYDLEKDIFYKRGLQEGIEEGWEEGREALQRSVITNMLQSGILTIEQIADFSGASVEMVQAIQAELDRSDAPVEDSEEM
jgi:hypothetical protein